MISPIQANIGEKAKTECCSPCKSECWVSCWPWKTKQIQKTPSSEFRQIEKVIEIYEKRKSEDENIRYEV